MRWRRLTTAPRPNTATVEFVSTLQVFQTAPRPVETPHPKRQAFLRSAALLIFAQEISATTVYSDMVEQLQIEKILSSNISCSRGPKHASRGKYSYVPHKMKDGFSIAVYKTTSSIRHDSLPLSASNLRAKVGLWTLAKNTGCLATLRSVARNDMVTRFNTGDSLTHGFDNAASFMS